MKKLYNIKLVNWLEAQESQSEVHAAFKQDMYNPAKQAAQRFERGQYKRFMQHRRNPND